MKKRFSNVVLLVLSLGVCSVLVELSARALVNRKAPLPKPDADYHHHYESGSRMHTQRVQRTAFLRLSGRSTLMVLRCMSWMRPGSRRIATY